MFDDDELSDNLLDDIGCSSKRRKDVLDDGVNSQEVAKRIKVKNEEDKEGSKEEGMLQQFPFHGMNILVKNEFNPNGLDPRGYDHPYGSKLPSNYCVDCKCKKEICHDKRFGLYCGLRVAEEIERKGANTMFGDDVKVLMKLAYNEILRVEIVQQIGVLDTHNNYIPPKCMETRSMKNVMNHFFYMKFTTVMKKRLEDGSKGKYGSGNFGFYSALKEQDTKKK